MQSEQFDVAFAEHKASGQPNLNPTTHSGCINNVTSRKGVTGLCRTSSQGENVEPHI